MDGKNHYTPEWLNEQIKKLIFLGIVKNDKEVGDKIGYNKSVISGYKSGAARISKPFAEAFLKEFGNELGKGSQTIVANKAEGIPIYEIPATAGGVANVSQAQELPSYRITMPGYEDCNFGMFVYGHSMYPTIENGSLILCRKMKNKGTIMYGEVYLIRTEDYLMVKRLQKSKEKGHVLCNSDNFEARSEETKRFEPFDLPIDEVIDLYLVKGILKKTQS